MDYTVHGILQVRILEWGAFPFSSGFPDPELEPGPPTLQVDSSPSEISGKPIVNKYSIVHLKDAIRVEHECFHHDNKKMLFICSKGCAD